MGIADQRPVLVTIEGAENSAPVYAVSLVTNSQPEGRAFLAITLEQHGTNEAVRKARNTITTDFTGEHKAVPIRLELAGDQPVRELQPIATGNLLDTEIQPL